MAEIHSLPALNPGTHIVFENNRRHASDLVSNHAKMDDLSNYVKDFPWLKGVTLINKQSQATVPDSSRRSYDSSSQKRDTSQDSFEIIGDSSSLPAFHGNAGPDLSLGSVAKNSPGDVSSQPLVNVYSQTAFPASNAVTIRALPRSNMLGGHVPATEDASNTTQTLGGHSFGLQDIESHLGPNHHGFPCLQAHLKAGTTSLSPRVQPSTRDSACGRQVSELYAASLTPSHAPSLQNSPQFFNGSTSECSPNPFLVQQGESGPSRHDNNIQHASQELVPSQQTTLHYFIPENQYCLPYGQEGQNSDINGIQAPRDVLNILDQAHAAHDSRVTPSSRQTNVQYLIKRNPVCSPHDQPYTHGGQNLVNKDYQTLTFGHNEFNAHTKIPNLQERRIPDFEIAPTHSRAIQGYSQATHYQARVLESFREPIEENKNTSSTHNKAPDTVTSAKEARPSYSQVVRPNPLSSEACIPTKKGEYLVVSIGEELYRSQIAKCKQSLIGKITYTLGDKPLSLPILKNRLATIWKTKGEFRIVPLGRSYFNISFDSLEDRKLVGARSRWALSPGFLRISLWTPGFNPYKLSSSKAQVWLRIYELPFEFWHSSIILGIAKAVGTPIKIDDRSLDGSVGHFVRVLVEVDLASPIQLEVMVDGPEYCDRVHLQFENLPLYCPNCKLVGHSVTNCFRLTKKDETHLTQEEAQVSKNKAQPKSTVVNPSSKSPQREGGRQRSRSRPIHKAVTKSSHNETSKDTSHPKMAADFVICNTFDAFEEQQPCENENLKVPSHPSIVAEIVTYNSFDALAETESNPKDNVNDERAKQDTVQKTHDNDTLQNPQRADQVNYCNNADLLAPELSTIVPYVQPMPKSILKKPSRGVLGTRSWADMAEDSLDNQLESAHNPFKDNGEESSKSAETQTEFKFSSSTQAIVDLVRSKAGSNFKVIHPSTSAARAMRSMVTKKWSSGNVG